MQNTDFKSVAVIGLGYVGLPLARQFVAAGLRVVGVDVHAGKVAALARGESPIRHIPADWMGPALASGQWLPTTDFDLLSEAGAVIICVPTPLTEHREPDLRHVIAAATETAKRLQPGQLVVLESTTYPGTTEEVLLPILQRPCWTAGKDFFLAFSPEREDPGNQQFALSQIPKVVGGLTPRCAEAATALYGHIFERVVPVSKPAVAELAKLLENVFRSVNIALVNELKMLCDRMGLNVWEVIDAAATKPFGFMPFYPGPGLGGHCIPIDPFYLTWKAREYGFTTRFIELSGEINTSMPQYVIQRLMEALNDQGKALRGARILVLGAAYKKDVDDPRESPSLRLMALLRRHGAEVAYNDPYIPRIDADEHSDRAMDSTDLTETALAEADCVLVATAHSCYDPEFIVRHARLVVDTRNLTRNVQAGREKIVMA